jgi:subtilisin family serine protease
MNAKHHYLTAFIIFISLLGATALLSTSAPATPPAYVEPSLWTPQRETLSLIVTASDSKQAAQAVERAGGQVSSDLWLIEAVAATLPARQLPTLAAQPGLVSIVADQTVKTADWPDWMTTYRFPVPWNGSPDAQPTADPKVWQLVNPFAIDVGADVLHKNHNITGQGVTVAVLDSGVRFSNEVKTALAAKVASMFKGQADFVGSGTCSGAGAQQSGYCFTNHNQSYDGYGHGSHVAGIIWNNFTDSATTVSMGIAPNANILSVRVLSSLGIGSYTDVIEGIQYVVANKATYNIRVLNVSLSALAVTPYFADPLNRAIEQAWANGIVVLAAAGNTGLLGAQSLTVPGNDPYVITVGAINTNRTPGYWLDDIIPAWSSTGPTLDGFAKPDVLAPGAYIVSFMYKDPTVSTNSDLLVQLHPDNASATSLFRMSGTSMSTAVASGVVALMLQQTPSLTPDQVKYRLMVSSRPALTSDNDLVYNVLQQGMGRIWAPEAVLGTFPADNYANYGMNINSDLAHGLGWVDSNSDGWVQQNELNPTEMAYHYSGQIGRLTSDNNQAYLYYLLGSDSPITVTLTPSQDTWFDAKNTKTNYSTATTFSVEGEQTRLKRGVLQFDLSSIPANATVLTATLTLKKVSGDAVSDTLSVNALTHSWTESGATWEKYDGQNKWASVGAYFDPAAAATASMAGNNSYTWNIKNLTQNWVKGTQPNYGVLLKQNVELTGNQPQHNFSSRESATGKPTLTITYSNRSSRAYTVYVDQDSWLKQAASGQNLGGDVELLTNNKSGDTTHLVSRFNLSSILPGSTIVSAKAYFWVTQTSNTPVNVHRITDSWTESGVTWSNTSADFDPVADATFTPASLNQYVVVDLKTLVQEWVNGAPNYGLMFSGTPSNNESKYFGKDQVGSNQDPYLEIVALDPVVLGAAWTANKAWIDKTTLANSSLTWSQGQISWNTMAWAGGTSQAAGSAWSGGSTWGGGAAWNGSTSWGGGKSWGDDNSWGGGYSRGGSFSWGSGYTWGGGSSWSGSFSGGGMGGGLSALSGNGPSLASPIWVEDETTTTALPTGPTTLYFPLIMK